MVLMKRKYFGGTNKTELGIDIGRYGFLNQTETTLSFDDTTNTLTLADAGAGWSYYRAGIKYLISGNKTVQLAGSYPAAANTYYVYIDGTTGALVASTTAWTLLDTKVPVAIINWNNSSTPKYHLQDERHTILIDRRYHYVEHFTEGTKHVSGGLPSGYTVVSDVNANKTFAISEAIISDEDYRHVLSALTQPNGTNTDYTVWYRTAAATWAWKKSNMPFVYNVGNTNDRVQWDNAGTMTDSTGGVGGSQRWLNSYLLYTTIEGVGRWLIVPGRGIYTSQALAQAEDPKLFDWSGVGIAEAVIAYQLTWRTQSYTSQGQCVLAVAPKLIMAAIIDTVGTAAPGNIPVSAQASSPVTVAETDSPRVYTNEGATGKIQFNLPVAVAGLEFTFIVQDSDGLRIVANTGDTIRILDKVTKATGYVESTTIGDFIRLKAINTTEWIAIPAGGDWTVETA